jgi:hypothetical protein
VLDVVLLYGFALWYGNGHRSELEDSMRPFALALREAHGQEESLDVFEGAVLTGPLDLFVARLLG